ncbi:MAG: ABC-type transport auxiliary lipoprotein family protein [Ferrovibrio sp.]|uniref:ABC-type transport auxiliary lipoprotein family protein n=1 Tax=Ferrovibrio sp. TaxID=1917215 RepID=UPI0026245F7B|nr:ABC-type transport auxiliary lipoprotein family protein [Ferrovibrio sp.]MCW0233222.1 ABC-type transport auxiliary lipoprotein family protein [Ferrovibrio sp.]
MSDTTRRSLLLAAAVLPLSASLSACGGLIPQTPPSNIYNLSPKTTFPDSLPRVDWQLVVEEPYAAGGLDSHKIAIYTNPYEVKYYAEARWAERAPRMVQTLLVESFENTGKIVAVGRQSVGLRSDFNLKSDLREFQAVLKDAQAAPEVIIVLQAKLIAQPRQQIVASATFERRAVAKNGSILSVVEAFDDALGKVLRDTVQWAMTAAKKEPA